MSAPAVEQLTQAEWLARIDEQASALALTLRDAADADVSHALILPRLMLAFRASFGAPPAGFTLPGLPVLPGLLGGGK